MRRTAVALSLGLSLVTGAAQAPTDELFPMTLNGQDWGYVDQSGKVVIAPKFEAALPFFEGLAAVKVDGRYGFIKADGTFAIAPRFNRVKSFTNGQAAVLRDRAWAYVRLDGQTSPWTGTWVDVGAFSQGLAPINSGDHWGYIDGSGREAFRNTFEESHPFNEGLAAVKVRGKYGFIDTSGHQVIDPTFDQVLDFHEGRAAVRVGERWGYIDSRGTLAIEPRFDAVGPFVARRADIVTGGILGEVRFDGRVVMVKGPPSSLIPYRITSEPSGATLYAIPFLDYRVLSKYGIDVLRLRSFEVYRRGTTDTTLDLFDQKYMLILVLGEELRLTLLDVIASSTVRQLRLVIR